MLSLVCNKVSRHPDIVADYEQGRAGRHSCKSALTKLRLPTSRTVFQIRNVNHFRSPLRCSHKINMGAGGVRSHNEKVEARAVMWLAMASSVRGEVRNKMESRNENMRNLSLEGPLVIWFVISEAIQMTFCS